MSMLSLLSSYQNGCTFLQIVETFARDCFVGYDVLCTDPSKYRFCLADEHYVSTLLAVSVLPTPLPFSISHGLFQVSLL